MKYLSDIVRAVLSLLLLGIFTYVLIRLLGTEDLNTNVKDVILVLLGALTVILKDAIGFFYQSSDGSKKKSDAIQRNGHG